MYITSLELVGYRRFGLNQIERLYINFTEVMQLILGANQSGKSSLLKELTPLPPQKDDYFPSGRKVITLQHNGHHYELRSTFQPRPEHLFLKDGGPLNHSKTATVQRQLVEQEFGITPELHQLFTGQLRFHSLTAGENGERRAWFTRLSKVDYSFALREYRRLKELQRDVTGALKLARERLAVEVQKRPTQDSETALTAEIADLRQQLHELLELKHPVTGTVKELEASLRQQEDQLLKLSGNFFKTRASFLNREGFASEAQLQDAILTAKAEGLALQNTLETTAKELRNQHSLLESAGETTGPALGLEDELQQTDRQINALKAGLLDGLEFPDPITARAAFQSMVRFLTELLAAWQEVASQRLSRTAFTETFGLEKQLSSEEAQLRVAQHRDEETKQSLEYYRDNHRTQCPNCQHIWFPGYDEQLYQALLKTLATRQQRLAAIETQLQALRATLAGHAEHQQHLHHYRSLCQSWPVLQPLWHYIEAHALLPSQPEAVIRLLTDVKNHLDTATELHNLTLDHQKRQRLAAQLAEDHFATLQELQAAIDAKEQQYSKLMQRQQHATQRWQTLQGYQDTVRSLRQQQRTLQELLQQQIIKTNQYQMLTEQEVLGALINELRLLLNEKEQRITQFAHQEAIISHLESQLKDLEVQQETLALLIRELSPSDGLIAKGLLGSINDVLALINGTIATIWTHPLQLLPYTPQSDEEFALDYRFEVKTGEAPPPHPDVSRTSTSAVDIIDFAFVLAVMKRLGFENYPLYLDEFGHSMDYAHRQAAFFMLEHFLQYENFSQIFLVSHFFDCYSGLKTAEVLVLTESNVVVPEGTRFNRHAVLE